MCTTFSFCFALLLGADPAQSVKLTTGAWRAWLDSPGGELPFGLDVQIAEGGHRVWVLNGADRLEVPKVTVTGEEIVLAFPHYDSTIRAKVSAEGSLLEGEYKKRGRNDKWVKLVFHATALESGRFRPPVGGAEACGSGELVRGRWSLKFERDKEPSVGVFTAPSDGSVTGTILTTTGDYGFLAGDFCRNQGGIGNLGGRLRLSGFDGSHAFLLTATTDDGVALRGDFWSGDTFHDTWTGTRDEKALLPDAFTQSRGAQNAPLDQMVFPDLDGNRRSLSDPFFAGRARIIEVFGSWCPNCNDASRLLVELHRQYQEKGLSIVGLAFEYTGDFQRDAEQVRAYRDYHKIEYPLLLAGVADREKASEALPLIDKLRAFPTTIFLDAAGRVREVHTGFSGPATGEEYQKLRTKFETLIRALLSEANSR